MHRKNVPVISPFIILLFRVLNSYLIRVLMCILNYFLQFKPLISYSQFFSLFNLHLIIQPSLLPQISHDTIPESPFKTVSHSWPTPAHPPYNTDITCYPLTLSACDLYLPCLLELTYQETSRKQHLLHSSSCRAYYSISCDWYTA